MHRIASLAALGIALTAGPAFADENSGLYLGVGLGDFSSEIDDIEDVDDVDIDFDEDNDASKIFGGWRLNRFVALQLDYIDFGNSSVAVDLLDFEAEAEGLAPSIVGTLPLGPIELFARGGIVFYDLDVNLNGDSVIDESGEDVVYGAGLGLTLLQRLALRAEYEVIEINEFSDAEAVWLTAAWRF